MFPLTAQRRHLVCRALFLSLAVVPTLSVCSWALAWNLPSHARGYQHALAGLIGHHVQFAEIAHPRPGVTRLVDIQLNNPETGDTILTADILETLALDNQITVTVDGVRCLAGGLPELLDLLAAQLSGRWETASSGRSVDRVRVLSSQWIVASNDSGAQTLDDVEIDLRLRNGVPWAQLRFLLPDHNGNEADVDDARITIEWVRNRNITPPTTGFVLDTGTSALPCGLLQAVFPDFDLLGSRATFRGKANLQLYADGWRGSIEGDLLHVPLERLLSGGSGRLLSGEANIVAAKIVLSEGHIASAGAAVSTAGGRISQTLIAALAECDGMVMNVPESGTVHRYERLACTVRLGANGLSLTAPNNDGAIMTVADGSPLIRETPSTVQPIALAAALLPRSEVMVPATPQAATLMRWLPIPQTDRHKSRGDRIATPQATITSIRSHSDTGSHSDTE
jgi:hypothetical protein